MVPNRPVPVLLFDLDGQRRYGGSVDGVAKAGVETIEGGVRLVNGDAGLGEGGFYDGVRPICNCKKRGRSELRVRNLGEWRDDAMLNAQLKTTKSPTSALTS